MEEVEETTHQISRCLSCNCMTKDIIDKIDDNVINIYCGKCHAFKREED